MQIEPPAPCRQLTTLQLQTDLCVIGGGLAGTCCALAAARAGIRVVLVQDRPVLGGNASSEVRLWVLGATAHMSNNNRWAREGGIVDEILVENMHRNPEGNPLIFDTILLEKVDEEPNITLLLNTAAIEVEKHADDRIAAIKAFCGQNATLYHITAPLFCDASGDGIAAFLAGAAFRMGAEGVGEFDEKFAPDEAYGHLLGHSMYFSSKDTGRAVRFVAPSFALKNIEKEIPRFGRFDAKTFGCQLWWIEYGGRLDTIGDSEKIKWELWRVVYGVWDYIKNSGKFPEAANLTLEWVSAIPGKRESRRFEGDVMLTQRDIIEQRPFADTVSFGGWSIDLHPADGVYSPRYGCDQWHSQGVYAIPYRCMYSRNIANLFTAGRIISASHVAFGSTRVMGTCAHGAQAVGLAAAQCLRDKCLPRELSCGLALQRLQRDLSRLGQHMPGVTVTDDEDLARRATITASSQLRLSGFDPDPEQLKLNIGWGQMLPVLPGKAPRVTVHLSASEATRVELQLRVSSRVENHSPNVTLASKVVELPAGDDQPVVFDFDAVIDEPRYAFYCVMANDKVTLRLSEQRVTGVLAVGYKKTHESATDIGVEKFEIWPPRRRPAGQNFACRIEPPLTAFGPENVITGPSRPVSQPNAWVADFADPAPSLTLQWPEPQTISRVILMFDPDYDHPMESVLMGHPERDMPFCVKGFAILDGEGRVLHECQDNHQARVEVKFVTPVTTARLHIAIKQSQGPCPAAIFTVRCYA